MPRRSASTISGFVRFTADENDHHVGVADVARRVPLEHRDAAGRSSRAVTSDRLHPSR